MTGTVLGWLSFHIFGQIQVRNNDARLWVRVMYRVSTIVIVAGSLCVAIAAGFVPANWSHSAVARSFIGGMIIGLGLRPYHFGLVPSETQARLLASKYLAASGPVIELPLDLID
jgi:hypothetical protein